MILHGWFYTLLHFSYFLLNYISLHCHCISISTYQQMGEAIRNLTTAVTAPTLKIWEIQMAGKNYWT